MDESTTSRLLYEQIITEKHPSSIRALVYSDLAALAAIEGQLDRARELIKDALAAYPECPSAVAILKSLSAESVIRPENESQATLCRGYPDVVLHDRADGNVALERPAKIAIVSAMFNWPSGGGGNVHTVQLTTALRQSNYQVHHFYLKYEPWLIGDVVGNPAGSQAISFTESNWSLTEIQARVGGRKRV